MKIRLALAFFLVFILAITALGCDKVKGSGVFYDGDTGDPIEFKVNIVTGKTNGTWTDVMGSIHLDDETEGLKVRGGPWMRFYEPNYFIVWDVHVNGEKYDNLDAFTGEDNSRTWFWIMIIVDNELVYDWWGWEDDVEDCFIITD